jgi:hypothetical protein
MPQVAATFWADECHAVHETGLGLLAAAAIVVDDCLVGEVGTAAGAAGFECQQAMRRAMVASIRPHEMTPLQQPAAGEAFQRDPLWRVARYLRVVDHVWRCRGEAGLYRVVAGPGQAKDQQVAAVLPCGAERQS